jgi:hypothetical protein
MVWDTRTYERCAGMNSEKKKCNKTKGAGRHIQHRHHWLGGWYGLLSAEDPRDQGYGKNKPRPDEGKRKDKRGIWHW